MGISFFPSRDSNLSLDSSQQRFQLESVLVETPIGISTRTIFIPPGFYTHTRARTRTHTHTHTHLYSLFTDENLNTLNKETVKFLLKL